MFAPFDQSTLLHHQNDNSYINDHKEFLELDNSPLSFFDQFPYPFELELSYQNEIHPLGHQQNDPFGVDDHQSESIIDKMQDITESDMKKSQDCKKNKKIHDNINDNQQQQMLRKRPLRRDRHSKISTAQGLRDRRMRLSLEVARDFFWLQDMLGFDKASKTVEWLLLQSKSEIVKIEKIKGHSRISGTKSSSSTNSECEVVSKIDSKDNKKSRTMRKAATHSALAKDLRQKARAKARKRTIEKIWSRKFNAEAKNQLDQISQVSSCSPFETGEELSGGTQSQNTNNPPLMEVVAAATQVEEPEIINMGKWTPYFTIHDYFHNPEAMAFSQEIQLGHYQIMEKQWEAYHNYQNLC